MSSQFPCLRGLPAPAAMLLAWSAAALPADPQAGAASVQQLPDIVVTAQKTQQTLQQVPASVSTLDGDFVRDIGATSFADLQDYTANVTIAISSSAGQFSIRGLGTPDSNEGFDPSVGTVVDGVYYGRSNFLAAFFHDLDRFEVLRGPQGTLFGKNSTSGVLNVVTAEPEEEFGGRLELLTGNYGDRSYRPVFSGSLGGGLSARLSGNYEHGDRGLLYNTSLKRPERNPAQDTTRLRLRYAPEAADWKLDISAFVSNQSENNNLFQLSQLTEPMLATVRRYDPQAEASARNFLNSANFPSLEKGLIRGVSATLDYDLGSIWGLQEVKLTSVTSRAEAIRLARDLDADFSPIPFIHDSLTEPSPYRQLSQELRLTGNGPDLFGFGHGFNFVAGAFFYDSTFRTSDLFLLEDLSAAYAYLSAAQAGQQNASAASGSSAITGQGAGPLGAALNLLNPATGAAIGQEQSARVRLNQRARDFALFGQFEHFFAEQWAFIGGLRLGTEMKAGDAASKSQGSFVPLIADQQDGEVHVKRRERDLSPKLGIKWEPGKRLGLYATWSRGFKSGGFNALPLNPFKNLEFGPERATGYELGAKARTEFLGGPARVSVSLFSTDFENLQVSAFQNNSFVILNAAAARSRGFETDLYWLPPVPGVSLHSSIGLADAKYRSYANAPAPSDAGQAQAPPGCTDQTQGRRPGCDIPTQDLSGHPLSYAPRWTASVVPAYTVPLPRDLGATVAVDLLYRGERFLNVDDDPRKLQPATRQVNTRITFADGSEKWAITVAAHNLTNQFILDQVIDQPLAPGNLAAVRTDRGRFYSANLSFAF